MSYTNNRKLSYTNNNFFAQRNSTCNKDSEPNDKTVRKMYSTHKPLEN